MTYINVNNPAFAELNNRFMKCVHELGAELDSLNHLLNSKEEALFGNSVAIWEKNQREWTRLYLEMLADIEKEAGKAYKVHEIVLEGDRRGQQIMLGSAAGMGYQLNP